MLKGISSVCAQTTLKECSEEAASCVVIKISPEEIKHAATSDYIYTYYCLHCQINTLLGHELKLLSRLQIIELNTPNGNCQRTPPPITS